MAVNMVGTACRWYVRHCLQFALLTAGLTRKAVDRIKDSTSCDVGPVFLLTPKMTGACFVSYWKER